MDLDHPTQAKIIHTLSKKIRSVYILPDMAEKIATYLEACLDEGAYDGITEGDFFAYALRTHLQEASQDEHLWVRWHEDPLPDGEEALRLEQVWITNQKDNAEAENYGFHRVERLPGNIGLVSIRYFHKAAWGGKTAAAAMNFVANTLGLIIDLRECTGGCPSMTTLISSYLFGPEPVHLDSIYWRDDDHTQQFWTLPHLQGARFTGKSVYILISRKTFSAGEGFAYNLQAQGRAAVIGENTHGGAHPGASYRIHPQIEAFIPIGRSINPVTQTDFEDTGVLPDIPTTAAEALPTAYRMALKTVIEAIGEPTSKPQQQILDEAETALRELQF